MKPRAKKCYSFDIVHISVDFHSVSYGSLYMPGSRKPTNYLTNFSEILWKPFRFFPEISASISNKSSIKLMCVSSYNNCSIDKSMPGPFGVDILSMVGRRAAVERLGCTFEWLLVSKVLWYQTEAELRWLGARTIMKSCSESLEPSCISSPSLNSETFHPSLSLTFIPPGNHHDLVWLIVLRSLLEVSSPWMFGHELRDYCPDFTTWSHEISYVFLHRVWFTFIFIHTETYNTDVNYLHICSFIDIQMCTNSYLWLIIVA